MKKKKSKYHLKNEGWYLDYVSYRPGATSMGQELEIIRVKNLIIKNPGAFHRTRKVIWRGSRAWTHEISSIDLIWFEHRTPSCHRFVLTQEPRGLIYFSVPVLVRQSCTLIFWQNDKNCLIDVGWSFLTSLLSDLTLSYLLHHHLSFIGFPSHGS